MWRLPWLAAFTVACHVSNPAYDPSARLGDGGTNVRDASPDGPPPTGGRGGSGEGGRMDAADVPVPVDAALADGPPFVEAGPQGPDGGGVALSAPLLRYALDEGSGLEASESSGGPPLALGPTTTWTAGRTGATGDGAVVVTDRGMTTVPTPEMLSRLRTGFTVALWLFWSQPSFIDSSVSFAGGPDTAWYLRLGVAKFPHLCGSLITTMEYGNCGDRDLPVKQWIHLAMTWDGRRAQLYSAGLPDGAPFEASGVLDTSLVTLLSFGTFGENGNPLYGALDDVRLYDRALSPDEVAALAR